VARNVRAALDISQADVARNGTTNEGTEFTDGSRLFPLNVVQPEATRRKRKRARAPINSATIFLPRLQLTFQPTIILGSTSYAVNKTDKTSRTKNDEDRRPNTLRIDRDCFVRGRILLFSKALLAAGQE
jgi:hypothetical protein